jgi:serine/threonine protein kinase/Tfp pilus assembly protein PilF
MNRVALPQRDRVNPELTDAGATDNEPPKTVRVNIAQPEVARAEGAQAATPPTTANTLRKRHNSYDSDLAVGTLEPVQVEFKPGDRVLGFTLLERLGNGAFAQVFLAEQDSLAGRRVVVKITPYRTQEPERLGRLQHTNIVPIHSVHQQGSVELICMPFLGRHTLAEVVHNDRLRRDSEKATQVATGSAFGSRSARARARLTTTVTAATVATFGTPALPEVEVQWVLRLLSSLAAGLDHAHRRGILHLDIKPANVLLAESGDPMLLDFNLSHDTTSRFREAVGGTIPYMSPEQLSELLQRGSGKVDGRSDLFSLGALAYELLTNEHPYAACSLSRSELPKCLKLRNKPVPSIRKKNPTVPHGVAAIIAKLLAPNPADRYQTALELKTDVDRQLANLPLLSAANDSVCERFAKWRRRNPWVPLRVALACVLGLSFGVGALWYQHTIVVRRAAAVAESQTLQGTLPQLRLDLASIGDTQARNRGCTIAEKRLASYGLPHNADWKQTAAFARLPEEAKTPVANDLGEVLLLLAHAYLQDRGRIAESDREGLFRKCELLISRAESCFDANTLPPFAFALRAEMAAIRGEHYDLPQTTEVKTARAHYLQAIALISAGKFHAALKPLSQTVTLEPGHAAAHFALGYCRQQLGQYTRALERYDTAHALLPKDPRPVFNRGLVYGMQKKHAAAEAEFTLAIEIDPTHAESYRNRAVARLRQGKAKWEQAESDLTEALEREAPPIPVFQLRAQVRTLLGNTRGAEEDRQAAKVYEPRTEGDYIARGRSRLPADPAGALADFEAAAKLNPASLPALQNQAHVHSEYRKDAKKSLELVKLVIARYPEYAPAHAGFAILLARAGTRDEAHKAAELALTLSDDPLTTYQLAGVYAQTAATHPTDGDRALALLRRAIGDGFRDVRTFETDSDLNPIRNRPEFVNLAKALKDLAQN